MKSDPFHQSGNKNPNWQQCNFDQPISKIVSHGATSCVAQIRMEQKLQNKKEQVQSTCAYFLERKKRKCRMPVKIGKKFCGEHGAHEPDDSCNGASVSAAKPRMPCPYDPNHSCFVANLEKHLERCNARPKELPAYVKAGINCHSPASAEGELRVNLGSLTDDELMTMVERVRNLHAEHIGKIPDSFGLHPCLEETLSGLTESRGSWRHVFQNSAILHNLQRTGLLSGDETFVEFGSGRGQLGYYLGRIMDPQRQSLVLIDKSSPRHKHENRFKVDGLWSCPVERIRADIADVDISLVPAVRDARCVVGVGKHLCGGATDLALQALHGALESQKVNVKGVSIALCCHHQCSWNTYVGKAFFQEISLTQRDFAVLRAMTSWATCGSRDRPVGGEKNPHSTEDNDAQPLPRYTLLGLDAATREKIGRQSKQLIDQGRIRFLLADSNRHWKARLVFYVETSVSLENVLLLAQRENLCTTDGTDNNQQQVDIVS